MVQWHQYLIEGAILALMKVELRMCLVRAVWRANYEKPVRLDMSQVRCGLLAFTCRPRWAQPRPQNRKSRTTQCHCLPPEPLLHPVCPTEGGLETLWCGKLLEGKRMTKEELVQSLHQEL
jgi:hypothetical protein